MNNNLSSNSICWNGLEKILVITQYDHYNLSYSYYLINRAAQNGSILAQWGVIYIFTYAYFNLDFFSCAISPSDKPKQLIALQQPDFALITAVKACSSLLSSHTTHSNCHVLVLLSTTPTAARMLISFSFVYLSICLFKIFIVVTQQKAATMH